MAMTSLSRLVSKVGSKRNAFTHICEKWAPAPRLGALGYICRVGALFCQTGRILEPWRCVKGPSQNNLQPVLKPCWKFRFLTHPYSNHDFIIKGQTLSHGNVSSDQFWKICHRCKHPSCNSDFPSTRTENIYFHPGPHRMQKVQMFADFIWCALKVRLGGIVNYYENC